MANKYIQPVIPKSGFSFVLAGALYRNFGGYGVYIKYKRGPRYKITLKQVGPKYSWYVCPDRELVIVKNSQDSDAFYPYGDSFDEYVDLSLYNDSVCKNLGIDYIMTNFVHNNNASANRLRSTKSPEDRIQVMSDSGGLQLARGLKGIINPRDLVEFYNRNVDAGMVLDLPLFFNDAEILKKAALQQRENTDVMMKYNKGVDLINIIHGRTEDERTRYRDIVEDKRIDRIALGGMGKFKPVAGLNILYDIIEGRQAYKQHHILGVYSSLLIPLLVKVSNSYTDVHITCDSTSHIQSAVNKAYHHQFDVYRKMDRVPIGDRKSMRNATRYLPCQCKVCTTLKYTDMLAYGANSHLSELFAVHNGAEMARYVDSLQDICLNSSPHVYNEIVKKQIGNNSELQEAMYGLEFIDIVNKHGLKAAKKKYAPYLNDRNDLIEYVPKHLEGFGSHQEPMKLKKAEILKILSYMHEAVKDDL